MPSRLQQRIISLAAAPGTMCRQSSPCVRTGRTPCPVGQEEPGHVRSAQRPERHDRRPSLLLDRSTTSTLTNIAGARRVAKHRCPPPCRLPGHLSIRRPSVLQGYKSKSRPLTASPTLILLGKGLTEILFFVKKTKIKGFLPVSLTCFKTGTNIRTS